MTINALDGERKVIFQWAQGGTFTMGKVNNGCFARATYYSGNMGVPADSRNREMMVASSEQLTVAKVGLCDLTAH